MNKYFTSKMLINEIVDHNKQVKSRGLTQALITFDVDPISKRFNFYDYNENYIAKAVTPDEGSKILQAYQMGINAGMEAAVYPIQDQEKRNEINEKLKEKFKKYTKKGNEKEEEEKNRSDQITNEEFDNLMP